MNDNQKQIIMNKNPFKERYQNNNDIYIHIRLQDLSKWRPGEKGFPTPKGPIFCISL